MVTLVVYNLQEFLSKVYKKIAGTLTLHYPGFEMVIMTPPPGISQNEATEACEGSN